MKKVLITGGAGFIGSHLATSALELGCRVVVVDDFTTGRRDNLPNDAKLRVIDGSMCEPEEWRSEVENVDTVFHLAALISSQDSLEEATRYMETNVGGLFRTMKAVRGKGVRFVFASSSTVYGQQELDSLSEATSPQPLTPYALSKLAGEHLLAMYAPLFEFSHVALRLFNVYGPKQNPDHPYANVTCKFARAAAAGSGVMLVGDGEQTRDFIYVDDVVEAFMLAARTADPAPIYNIGTGRAHSIRFLLDLAHAEAAAPLAVEQRPPWKNDIRRVVAECSRARAELDWAPRTSLEDGFAETVEYFRA